MIASIYERKKLKRLEEKGIVIETLYYNVNQSNGKTYVRATDGKMLDDITDKAIKEKRYFKNGECIYRENNFNPRIHYTIKTYQNEDEDIKCPNCGNRGKAKNFIDNCPYCNTNFNFGISNTNRSSREKIQNITSPKFWVLYALSVIISTILFKLLFNKKVFASTVILLIITMLMLFLIGTLIIGIIREKRNKMYKTLSKQDQKNIWKSEKNEKTFYNDLYKEIVSYLYCQKDLIDFDILDYNGIEFINETEIRTSCDIRKVTYQNEIKSERKQLNIKMKYQESNKIDENYKTINCSNCGASIDISKKECNHCEKIININNEWIMEEIKEK